MKTASKDGEAHPSYATVTLSRWQGSSRRLFGSPIKVHNGITLTIHPARKYYDIHQENIHGELSSIVEIDMTPGQFADMLANFNNGSGSPCTLTFARDVGSVPGPPEESATEYEQIQKDLEDSADDFARRFADAQKKVKAILDKPSVGKEDRRLILQELDFLEQHISGNFPYFVAKIHDAAKRIVVGAKNEISSFAEAVLKKAGIEHLKGDAARAARLGFEGKKP